MPDDIDNHIAAWEALVDRYVVHRTRVWRAYPKLDSSDVRLALYGLPGNALVTGLLNIKMTKSCLLNTSWWDQNVKSNREIEKRQHQTDEFVVHSKLSVFVLAFSFYESVIRETLRAARPGACNNGFAAFSTVYTSLLMHLSLQRHVAPLDFARTLRNLIHNNGTYFGKNGVNETLCFDGKHYLFEHQRKVNFAYSELLFSIYEALLSLSDDINAHPQISGLPPTLMP